MILLVFYYDKMTSSRSPMAIIEFEIGVFNNNLR